MTLEVELISIPKEEYTHFLAQQKGVASSLASTLAQSGAASYSLVYFLCLNWVLIGIQGSNEALSFIEAFHALLGDLALFPTALIGLHFQVLGVSPLHTHFAIILLFFMATIVHRIAYTEIKLRPQDAGYLPILSFICLVSGIIAIELLFAIIISPFWLFMVNLCPILILGVLRHLYQQIYQCVYYTANLVLNSVCSLFKKICELVDQIYDWVLQKFQ